MLKTLNKLKDIKYIIYLKSAKGHHIYKDISYSYKISYTGNNISKIKKDKRDITSSSIFTSEDKKKLIIETEFYLQPEEELIKQVKSIKDDCMNRWYYCISKDIAKVLDADIVATGHFATIFETKRGIYYKLIINPKDGRSPRKGFNCTLIKIIYLKSYF